MKKSHLSRRITWRVIAIVAFFNVLIIAAIQFFVHDVSVLLGCSRSQYVIDGISGKMETMTAAVHQYVGDYEQSDDLTMLAFKLAIKPSNSNSNI